MIFRYDKFGEPANPSREMPWCEDCPDWERVNIQLQALLDDAEATIAAMEVPEYGGGAYWASQGAWSPGSPVGPLEVK